jgi:hypothetical protein
MKLYIKTIITLAIVSGLIVSGVFFFALRPIAELNRGLDSRWTMSIHELFNTRKIPGTRVYLGYYKESEETARRLAKKLKFFGAIVRSNFIKNQSDITAHYRNKNTFCKPLATDTGMEQVLMVASSVIEFESILDREPFNNNEPVTILLYK